MKLNFSPHLNYLFTCLSFLLDHQYILRTWTASFFLFFIIIFFTLQYCIGFSIHQHASTTGVHVFPILNPLPPPSPYHPSGSSQCTSPKLPVSCIEPGLAICFLYDIIHVLMPFSQIIPLLPLPQSPKDCSIHLCLFCCLAYILISFAKNKTILIYE